MAQMVGAEQLRKWPLLIAAVWYGAGVVLGERVDASLRVLFPLAFLALCAAMLSARHLPWVLPVLLVLAGWTHQTTRTAVICPHDLRTLLGDRPELVTVRGVLTGTPSERIQERDERKFHRTLARVRVEAIRCGAQWQPAHGVVAVGTPGVLGEEYYAGQVVEVTGVVARPQTAAAPGLFDYRAYLRHQGIFYHLRADGPQDWRLLLTPDSPRGPPWSLRFSRWAHGVLGLGLPAGDETVDLLRAMTLGWRTALNGEVSQPFMRSGTMHLFAISGLHVALIAGILIALLRSANVPRFHVGLICLPLLWFYTAATGWQPSAVRSTIMMTVIIAGWMLPRPSNLLNSLGAAAFLILMWDPQQLFQAGFQLSFLVVLSIGLLVPPFIEWRDRLLQPDPFLPPELIPRWQRRAHDILRWLTTSIVTSFAAWLGSLPLIAHYFHLFTPVSLLANIVVVPLSGCALAANLGALICGTWLPGLTGCFNHAAWFFMRAMVVSSEWFADLPAAWVYVPSFTTMMYFSYYALLLLVIARVAFAPRWRMATALAFATLLLPALARWHDARTTTRLTVLALPGGDAIHLDAPGREHDLLIDCGNESATENVVAAYLHAQGVNSLPRLLLTHGDLRHVGGAPLVREQFRIDKIITSAVRSRSPMYRRLLQELEQTPEHWQPVRRGDTLGPWQVLHPLADDNFSQGDDNAIVLRGEFHGARVLLLSDLGKSGQRALLEREPDLRADIVVTGLPAQGEPVLDDLLAAVQPRLLIISCSEYPAQEQAKQELRARLARRGVPVHYTGDAGSVTLAFRKDGWQPEP
ncbi:MAG: ComEC/Rec2 family competence protein [Verrucomicrobiota bacterium]